MELEHLYYLSNGDNTYIWNGSSPNAGVILSITLMVQR